MITTNQTRNFNGSFSVIDFNRIGHIIERYKYPTGSIGRNGNFNNRLITDINVFSSDIHTGCNFRDSELSSSCVRSVIIITGVGYHYGLVAGS